MRRFDGEDLTEKSHWRRSAGGDLTEKIHRRRSDGEDLKRGLTLEPTMTLIPCEMREKIMIFFY